MYLHIPPPQEIQAWKQQSYVTKWHYNWFSPSLNVRQWQHLIVPPPSLETWTKCGILFWYYERHHFTRIDPRWPFFLQKKREQSRCFVEWHSSVEGHLFSRLPWGNEKLGQIIILLAGTRTRNGGSWEISSKNSFPFLSGTKKDFYFLSRILFLRINYKLNRIFVLKKSTNQKPFAFLPGNEYSLVPLMVIFTCYCVLGNLGAETYPNGILQPCDITCSCVTGSDIIHHWMF